MIDYNIIKDMSSFITLYVWIYALDAIQVTKLHTHTYTHTHAHAHMHTHTRARAHIYKISQTIYIKRHYTEAHTYTHK